MQNCKTVRRRAIEYLITLTENGITYELPLEKAKTLFSQILDVWDRTTLKAYFGTQTHRSTQRFRRRAQYQSGVTSMKTIELSQDISASPGYLEKMGLVSYELKGHVWFMKIESAVLVPQLMKVDVSMKNISLSPIDVETNYMAILPKGKGSEGKPILEVFPKREDIDTINKQKNNNLQGEREKTGSVEGEDDTQPLEYLRVLQEVGRKDARSKGRGHLK